MMAQALRPVNTQLYGVAMTDQVSATDWVDQGLKALATNGFAALKAEPLARLLGVSRGSFYWHFRDVDAFRAAVLARWRDIAAERVIADLETLSDHIAALPHLLRRGFREGSNLEVAIRSWAAHDSIARKAVQAIDRRRLSYLEGLLRRSGAPAEAARARAQILYWVFLGFVLSGKRLPRKDQDRIIDELLRLSGSAD